MCRTNDKMLGKKKSRPNFWHLVEAGAKSDHQKQEKVMQTKAYQDQKTYLNKLTNDFLHVALLCRLMAARSDQFAKNSLVMWSFMDLVQSSLSVDMLIREGMHTPARREMRYMLESAMKNLLVDQKKPGLSLSKKIQYLHREVDRSSIEGIKKINLVFTGNARKAFLNDVNGMYSRLCAYIHPSKHQIKERVTRDEKGVYLGLETAKELRQIAREVFRLCDIVLVFVFHGLGLGLAGDVFVYALDDHRDWKFHRGKYVRILSKYFDYKFERQEKARLTQPDLGPRTNLRNR